MYMSAKEEAIRMIENELTGLPILQYAFLKTEQVSFLQRVRNVCEQECPRYGTSWSCPPAVGSVEECRLRCLRYEDCFVFSTIAEETDASDLEQALKTRMEHEEITRQTVGIFRRHFGDVIALSTESCEICADCTYPHSPCRYPDRMFPCVESYGILVTELAEKGGISYQNGAGTVTWFSVLFFRKDTDYVGKED